MDLLNPAEREWAIVGLWAGGRAISSGELQGLTADDFADRDANAAFAACMALNEGRTPVNLQNLDERLTRVHGSERASEIMQRVSGAAMQYSLEGWKLPEAVGIVREAAKRRRLVKIGEALSRGAADEQRDITALIDAAREHLRNSLSSRGGWQTATDACLETYEAAEQCAKPYRTGIHELDTVLCGGLRRGELTILGARPAVGKSAALLSMALTAARDGANACFVSLEMSAQQIGARILSASSGVNPSAMQSGRELSESTWTRLAGGMERIGADGTERLSLLVHGGLTVEELRTEIQTQVDAGKCDVLFIDYIQLLRTKRRTSSDFERVGVVSQGLKALTLDLGIPVVAAAQVRRQGGTGGILRAPALDELRGSGDLEQDADNVILLHRPESPEDSTLSSASYANRHNGLFERVQTRNMQLLTFDVAKQRQGMTVRAWTAFQPSQMKFIDPGVIV